MLKPCNFRAGRRLYSTNCYEQGKLCRAYSEGSKLIVANGCDCLREQARARKKAIDHLRLVVRDVCLDRRHRFPPYSQREFSMPSSRNTDTLKKLMYRPQDCFSDLLFFRTPWVGARMAARMLSVLGRGVVGSMGAWWVFRLRRPPQNAGMKHHSIGGNDSSAARSYSDDGCFWSPSPDCRANRSARLAQ